MAFCENCGAQLSGSGKFCSECGKPVGKPGPASQALPESKKSRSYKILLTVAAVGILLVVGAVATTYYFVRRATAKTVEVAPAPPDVNANVEPSPPPNVAEPTTPAPSTTSSGLDPNKIVTPADGQCAIFTTEELSQVLGATFTHHDADATGCTYKGDGPRLWVRTEVVWKGGRKLVKAKADNYKALRQSMINQHYSKADVDAHVFPMQPYPGVGEEAWINLWNVVTARKEDYGVTMDLRYYHDSDDVTKMLTNTALSRLRDKRPDPSAKEARQ